MKIINTYRKNKSILLRYNSRLYPYDIIKYVFYTLTDDFFIFLSKEKNYIKAEITPKKNEKVNDIELGFKIQQRIKNEMLREKIFKNTLKLNNFIIKKTIT
ncbi:MAG: hypothetical protein KA059_03135 [Elusimicrobiales bacterium]|nr:hypothetical protein [Elusimicrobiales bacterium]